MKPTTIALLLGRLLGIVGALLVLAALTWPWMTLRLSTSVGRPVELQLSFSGSDISALAAASAALAPKLIGAIDTLIEKEQSATIALVPIRERLTPMQRAGAPANAWIAALWLPPIVALVLATLLLVANGQLRFRRGIGAVLILLALVSLVVLIMTRQRIDGLLAQLRTIPALDGTFESLDQSGMQITLRSEGGVTSAAVFAALILIGGLIELILPLRALAQLGHAQPALQTASAAGLSAGLPSAPVAPSAGERSSCIGCGRALPLGARFCGGCGRQQV